MSTLVTAHEGQTIACSNQFDKTLRKGYPKAKLLFNKEIISVLYPENIGQNEWSVTLTIPNLQLVEPTPLKLIWKALDTAGNSIKESDLILVQPSQLPESGDIVIMEDELGIQIVIPVHLEDSSSVTVTFYEGNELKSRLSVDPNQREKFTSYTILRFNRPNLDAMLDQYLTVIEYNTFNISNQRLMLNLWVVTPQILNCMNGLESSLNKAKIDNVIPQLNYTQSDLLQYLQRGLNLFNSYSPNLTGFTGTNMQGALYDALILCASYYALGAQLLAEGMLAFDFSGQAVTLNVDRTPALEGALGRVESQINEKIPKLKQLLLRRGVSGGSGSDAIGSSRGFGHVVLSNAPTTSKNVFRPGMAQYYYR